MYDDLSNLTLGERIRYVRSIESRTTFGARFGKNRNTIMRYETGKTVPAEFLIAICEEFDIDGDWMLLGKGPLRKSDPSSTYIHKHDENCRCHEMLNRKGHIFSTESKTSLGMMGFVLQEKHKLTKGLKLTERNEADILYMAYSMCVNKDLKVIDIICSIVKKWINFSEEEKKLYRF